MSGADYYPAGAYNDPNAPYNQEDVPDMDFEVTCSQTLSRTVTVTTNNYVPGASGVDYEPDGEGGYSSVGWNEPDDTSDTNWSKIYKEEHLTPLEIIKECKNLAELCMGAGWQCVSNAKVSIRKLIEECEGWTEDETEFVKE